MNKNCCSWREASGDVGDMKGNAEWIETIAWEIRRYLEQNNREKLSYWMEELECEVSHLLEDWEIYRRKEEE